MKIIEASFEIQDDLDHSSLASRIELCGRVCYKSEGKITEDSAIPFVTRVAAHGHNSVLEMAVVSFQISCHPDHVLEFLSCQPKFFIIDRSDQGLLLTGSIRSFRELYGQHPDNQVINDLLTVLAAKEPFLFEGVFEQKNALALDPQIVIKKIGLDEVENLPEKLLRRHRFVGVKFVVNRAVSHEIVRHRLCSFLQESQRYCRYSQDQFDGQVTFIKPTFYEEGSEEFRVWQETMETAENSYLKLQETSTAQAARTVLPNSCKTEIIVYCNLTEWQHILKLRTAKGADPSIRAIMIPLAEKMEKRYQLMS